jgi:hypothetical protein
MIGLTQVLYIQQQTGHGHHEAQSILLVDYERQIK